MLVDQQEPKSKSPDEGLPLAFLMVPSSILAVVGFIIGFLAYRNSVIVDSGHAIHVSAWCLNGCIGLAILAFVMYRWRGAWLLLPLLVAFCWPFLFILYAIGDVSAR